MGLKQQAENLIRKHVPRLQELSFGCEVEHIPFHREIYIGHADKEIVFKVHSATHPYVFSANNSKEVLDDMRIIGHPIHLEHVLEAIKDTSIEFAGYYGDEPNFMFRRHFGIEKAPDDYIQYNLSLPFTDQSDDLYKFIVDILS